MDKRVQLRLLIHWALALTEFYQTPSLNFDTTPKGSLFEREKIHEKLNSNDRFICFHFHSEDEISLNKGLHVNVLQKKTDGWWLVQNDKERGWFPSNYLIEVNRNAS